MGATMYIPVSTPGSKDNIRAVLPDVIPTGSTSWYAVARRQCRAAALAHGYDVRQFTAVVAALSPGRYWTRNIRDAIAFLNGEPIPQPCGGNPLRTAMAVMLDGPDAIPSSQVKVRSFFDNLTETETSTAVTVDSHAASVWAGRRERGSVQFGESLYRKIERDYQELAAEYGVLPHEIQAAAWVARVEGD